jgi:hypothetical protein
MITKRTELPLYRICLTGGPCGGKTTGKYNPKNKNRNINNPLNSHVKIEGLSYRKRIQGFYGPRNTNYYHGRRRYDCYG